MLTEEEFDSRFTVIRNSANGNCLFESIEHVLNFSEYEFTHGITNAEQIRKLVGEYYKTFNRDTDYPESTIEFQIKMGILFDNMDEDEEMHHEHNICNDRVWASMTDVLICSVLFGFNVYLYVRHSDKTYEVSNMESKSHFINNKKSKTIHLLYSGNNHFEALDEK